MHRVTARCCFLLVAAFCALSVSSAVAADDDAAKVKAGKSFDSVRACSKSCSPQRPRMTKVRSQSCHVDSRCCLSTKQIGRAA